METVDVKGLRGLFLRGEGRGGREIERRDIEGGKRGEGGVIERCEALGAQGSYFHLLWPTYIVSNVPTVMLVACAGDVIRWEQQIRFRHMTTRQYLCITSDRRVSLTPDCRDPRTVFRLHPVIKVCSHSLPNIHEM